MKNYSRFTQYSKGSDQYSTPPLAHLVFNSLVSFFFFYSCPVFQAVVIVQIPPVALSIMKQVVESMRHELGFRSVELKGSNYSWGIKLQ